MNNVGRCGGEETTAKKGHHFPEAITKKTG